MAKCNFSIEFSDGADALVSKAGSAIGQAGGSFDGDSSQGTFHLNTGIGSVRGNYTIQDSTIHIQIDQKPMLVSCNRIEEELRKRLV